MADRSPAARPIIERQRLPVPEDVFGQQPSTGEYGLLRPISPPGLSTAVDHAVPGPGAAASQSDRASRHEQLEYPSKF